MLVYRFVKLLILVSCSFGFYGNLFPSMTVCGDVSDILVSLLLPVAYGTSVTHLAIALLTPCFCSYHILTPSVICY